MSSRRSKESEAMGQWMNEANDGCTARPPVSVIIMRELWIW